MNISTKYGVLKIFIYKIGIKRYYQIEIFPFSVLICGVYKI